MKKSTAIFINNREIDIACEGNRAHTLYMICEVLHRNTYGDIDHYRRLYAYGFPRSKQEALAVLANIKVQRTVREYKEPRLYRRRKYFVRDTGEKARAWGVNPGTIYYFIEKIDDPYKAKSHQVRSRYRGPELDTLSAHDYCDFAKVSDLADKLDDAYWQEYQSNRSKYVEIVDRRRSNT